MEHATNPDPTVRNPAAALEYARRLVALEKDHPDASHLDTLAEACCVNGQHSEAIEAEQRAIALATDDSKADFQDRLKKYQRALAGSRRVSATAR